MKKLISAGPEDQKIIIGEVTKKVLFDVPISLIPLKQLRIYNPLHNIGDGDIFLFKQRLGTKGKGWYMLHEHIILSLDTPEELAKLYLNMNLRNEIMYEEFIQELYQRYFQHLS